jgi:hypothetical protein
MAQQNNVIAQLQTALLNTPPNSPGETPMTPNRLAAHRANETFSLLSLRVSFRNRQLLLNQPS